MAMASRQPQRSKVGEDVVPASRMFPLRFLGPARENTIAMLARVHDRQQLLEQVSFACQVSKPRRTPSIHCSS
jgi:hypothetical protein